MRTVLRGSSGGKRVAGQTEPLLPSFPDMIAASIYRRAGPIRIAPIRAIPAARPADPTRLQTKVLRASPHIGTFGSLATRMAKPTIS